MSEKRFIVESVMIDCLCEDEPRIAKVITDTDETYSYEDLYEVAELLNEQQSEISRRELERKVKLQNENIILKKKIKDLRVSLFMQDKELQRQMRKSDLDE